MRQPESSLIPNCDDDSLDQTLLPEQNPLQGENAISLVAGAPTAHNLPPSCPCRYLRYGVVPYAWLDGCLLSHSRKGTARWKAEMDRRAKSRNVMAMDTQTEV